MQSIVLAAVSEVHVVLFFKTMVIFKLFMLYTKKGKAKRSKESYCAKTSQEK